MTQNRLMLDYVLDHEEKLRDHVYMTQPIGNNQVVDYTWGQVVDQSRRMATYLQSQGLPARRAHRDPVEELRALHHGRGGDLDGGLHDGRHFPDRDRRDDQLRADAQRGEPAVRRQARHLAAAAARRARRAAVRRVSARTEDRVRHLGRDRRAYRTNRRAAVAQCRRTGDADLHLGFDRNTEGRDDDVRGVYARRRGHHGRRTAPGRRSTTACCRTCRWRTASSARGPRARRWSTAACTCSSPSRSTLSCRTCSARSRRCSSRCRDCG